LQVLGSELVASAAGFEPPLSVDPADVRVEHLTRPILGYADFFGVSVEVPTGTAVTDDYPTLVDAEDILRSEAPLDVVIYGKIEREAVAARRVAEIHQDMIDRR
jgi:hypothetical protein